MRISGLFPLWGYEKRAFLGFSDWGYKKMLMFWLFPDVSLPQAVAEEAHEGQAGCGDARGSFVEQF